MSFRRTFHKRAWRGSATLLVVYDLGTGWLGAYPVQSKAADRVLRSLSHFLGNQKAKNFHSDRAPELLAAVKMLPGPPPETHRTSVPGVHQTNSIAETRVKQVIHGTRTNLLGAGLPTCWWPYAARCYAFQHNWAEFGGPSPATARGLGQWKGQMVPFGARGERDAECDP